MGQNVCVSLSCLLNLCHNHGQKIMNYTNVFHMLNPQQQQSMFMMLDLNCDYGLKTNNKHHSNGDQRITIPEQLLLQTKAKLKSKLMSSV